MNEKEEGSVVVGVTVTFFGSFHSVDIVIVSDTEKRRTELGMDLRPCPPSSLLPCARGRAPPLHCCRRRRHRIGDREVCDQIQRLVVERPEHGHRLPKDHRADPCRVLPRYGANPPPFQLKVETHLVRDEVKKCLEEKFSGLLFINFISYPPGTGDG